MTVDALLLGFRGLWEDEMFRLDSQMRSTQVQALIENGQLWENVARTRPLPHKGYKALTPPVDNDTPAILIVLIRDKFIHTTIVHCDKFIHITIVHCTVSVRVSGPSRPDTLQGPEWRFVRGANNSH